MQLTFLLHFFVRPVDRGDLDGVVAFLAHCHFLRDALIREIRVLFEFLRRNINLGLCN